MKYVDDKRIVMTLDAGGTNLVFTAIQGIELIILDTANTDYSELDEGNEI